MGVPVRFLPLLLRVLVQVALILHLDDFIHIPIHRALHRLLVGMVVYTVVLGASQLVALARSMMIGLVDHLPLSIHRLSFVPRVHLVHIGRTHDLRMHVVLIGMVG